MATVTPGITFVSGETVTPAKLNSAATPTISAIQTADISDNQITTAKIVDANVTDAKLATGAVTGAAGGGKLAASAITSQTELTDPLASADEFLVHDDSASALRRVAWSSLQPNGTMLQTIQVTKTALQNCTTNIPKDNTIPQNTEGDEIFTATITPTSASSKILIQVVACGTSPVSGNFWATVALFKDAATDAIAVGPLVPYYYSGGSVFSFLDTAGTTSAITYKVRAGNNSGSFYLNGDHTGAALYGGKQTSSITLQEIKA